MSQVTFQIENTNIVFHNSIIGKEIVKLNGKTVSSKHSCFGTKHEFRLTEDDENEFRLITKSYLGGIIIELTRNNQIIGSSRTNYIFFVIGVLVVYLALKSIDLFL